MTFKTNEDPPWVSQSSGAVRNPAAGGGGGVLAETLCVRALVSGCSAWGCVVTGSRMFGVVAGAY